MTFAKGDRVYWVDDPGQVGTVLRVSDEIRRDWEGNKRPDLAPMVRVRWGRTGRTQWQTPDLLRKVEA